MTDRPLRPGERIDSHDGRIVRPGCMTKAEFDAWWEAGRRRWRAWSFAEEPPEPTGWAWTDLHGWCRQSRATRDARGDHGGKRS